MSAPTLYAGIGYRSATTAAEIVALVDDALLRTGHQRGDLTGLAVRQHGASHDAPAEAARGLGIALHPMTGDELAACAGRCKTESKASQRHTGLPSVAEAAALAAAGDAGDLVLPRIKSANATCALARCDGSTP